VKVRGRLVLRGMVARENVAPEPRHASHYEEWQREEPAYPGHGGKFEAALHAGLKPYPSRMAEPPPVFRAAPTRPDCRFATAA
jgi:hypothetical protein